ncbi:MAG: hypothetical protein ABFD08_06300 [Syntrophomonas sp.]
MIEKIMGLWKNNKAACFIGLLTLAVAAAILMVSFKIVNNL